MANLIKAYSLVDFKKEYKSSLNNGKFDFVKSKKGTVYCVLKDDSLLSVSSDFDANLPIAIGSYKDDEGEIYHYMYNPAEKEIVMSI